MTQRLFKSGLGFSDANISYLSGTGSPGGITDAKQDAAGVGSIYSDIATGDTFRKITAGAGTANWTKIATSAEVTAATGDITALQTEVDNTQLGAGLGTNGAYTATGGSNYLTGATSLDNADQLLDTQVKATADALTQEITDRGTADTTLQTNIDGKVAKSGDTMTGNLVMTTGNHITVPDAPVNGTDAVNKTYVDANLAGLTWKNSVVAMSDTNITLSGIQTIDGAINIVAGDRVLVTGQTTASQNGIYVVAAGAWTRSLDMDATTPLNEFNSAAVFIDRGTVYADTGWTQTANVIAIGTDAVAFTQFNGAAGVTAGTGLSKTGNTLDVNMGAGIGVLPSDEVGVDVKADGGLDIVDPITGLHSELTDAQLAVKLDSTTLTSTALGLKVSDATIQTITDAQAAADAAQAELDITQTGAGLQTTGAYLATAGSNYLTGATSLDNADQLLDTQIKTVADDLAALGTGSITTLQTEVDAIETASGNIFGADGTYTAATLDALGNVTASTTLANAIGQLDSAITTNASNISTNAGNISTNTTNISNLTTALAEAVAKTTTVGAVSIIADSVLVDDVVAGKWLVTVTDTTSGQREAMVVYASHNGFDASDATATDSTAYAELRFGNPIHGLSVDAALTGTGAAQAMQLVVSTTSATVSVVATRLTA